VHRHYQEPGARPLTRTRLVKLLYLADVAGWQRLGRPVTPVEWKSYYYGPFSADVLAAADALDGDTIVQSQGLLSNGDRYFCYTPARRGIVAELVNADDRGVLDGVIRDNATKPLNEILETVYERTPYKDSDRQLGETIRLRPN